LNMGLRECHTSWPEEEERTGGIHKIVLDNEVSDCIIKDNILYN